MMDGGSKSMKRGAPGLSNYHTFQQLWDAVGSKLVEASQGQFAIGPNSGIPSSSPVIRLTGLLGPFFLPAKENSAPAV